VHPVTILAIDTLAANFNFNLLYELLARAIKPSSIVGVSLCYFRKSYLKISAIS
jgi:hypothetical protein